MKNARLFENEHIETLGNDIGVIVSEAYFLAMCSWIEDKLIWMNNQKFSQVSVCHISLCTHHFFQIAYPPYIIRTK